MLDGDPDPLPPKKNGHTPHTLSGPFLLWPNGWMDQDPTWYGGRLRPRQRCVRWGLGTQLPPKRDTTPQFSAQVFCDQTAGWMKMPFGTEVDLGPGHIVLDGDASSPRRRGTTAPPSLFGPYLLWPRSPISATAELLIW